MSEGYKACIDACVQCAAVCRQCAASSLAEADVGSMVYCIQLDLECASLCTTTAELMILGSGFASRLCQVCADMCLACAAECEKHQREHCRLCASACNACAKQCLSMTAA